MVIDISSLEQSAREVIGRIRKQERSHQASLQSLVASRKSIERTLAQARRAAASGDQQDLRSEVELLIESGRLILGASGSPAPRTRKRAASRPTASAATAASTRESITSGPSTSKPKGVGVRPQALAILTQALSAERLDRDLVEVARRAFEQYGGLDHVIPVPSGQRKFRNVTIGDELARGHDSQLRTSIANSVKRVRSYQAGEFDDPAVFHVHSSLKQLALLFETKKPRQVDAMLKAWGVQVS